MSEYGTIAWPSAQQPIWQLSYALVSYPDAEGIAITQARYRGHQVFYKASLPSLRVQYDGNAVGPYKDSLSYDNAQPLSGTNRVKVYTVWSWGLSGVAVESFHQIGWYKLIERWTFWADGRVTPRLYSGGLLYIIDHRHHPYWRFDFDVDGAAHDTVFEYNTTTPDLGWGPGWHVKQYEISRVKNAATARSWAIMDIGSQRGYHIIPGPTDGIADAFAPRDLWVLRYQGAEDRHGQQGNATDDGLAAYMTGEATADTDVVVWYCAHMAHHAEPERADEYHSGGPTLIPFRW